ncbi:MAG: hypothetical protein JRC77_10050, partial [Deltaproteobacteria bacterium]|nr:hypothetical protein [Deltaproteobacteria bacterium]
DRSILRSLYFWIEDDEDALLNAESPAPLIDTAVMLEGRAVVSAPSAEEPYFTSPESIDQLFAEEEREDGRWVTTGTAWLPVLGDLDPACEGKPGSVFRIPQRIFHSPFAFRSNEIDFVGLYDSWGSTLEQTATKAFYSKEESEVFQRWMEKFRQQCEEEERAGFKGPRRQTRARSLGQEISRGFESRL